MRSAWLKKVPYIREKHRRERAWKKGKRLGMLFGATTKTTRTSKEAAEGVPDSQSIRAEFSSPRGGGGGGGGGPNSENID